MDDYVATNMDVFLATVPSETTTIEITCVSKAIVPGVLYDSAFHEDVFMGALDRMRKHGAYPVSEKRYKRYSQRDYECIVTAERDTFVVKKKLLQHLAMDHKRLLVCAQRNDSALPYKFPWSADMQNIVYVTRVTFKVGKRLSMQLEARRASLVDAVPTYHVGFVYDFGRDSRGGSSGSAEDSGEALKRVPGAVHAALGVAGLA